ncbi:alpha/beta fold hydrolase [Cellulomonas bogoriensis]|uniref:Alpha/beta hydrolase n=1 Tax=Cellulomonas bogoriensis 69B4 = DSM 16987 TaxID=1386082 RepID=A0A0A0C1F9_9CELL|nr:alpha/beta hydrolase [Cellulomonas bogoriensis]KGM13762.1 alpha/beta hydrolase [Cellulomonas bogoriensis 69B4 = DSM 16987]
MTRDRMLRLHVLREGEAGLLPLVLLHGFPLDHRMWLDVTDLLPGDRTVLAPDLPGFGASPSGPDIAAALGADRDAPSVDVMADGVAATLRSAGVDRAVIGGLSMGGYVAMALLERHPDLVAGVGLIDTKSTADDEGARSKRLEIARTVVAEHRVDAVFGMRTSVLGASNRVARPDLVERIEGWIRDQGPRAVAWAQEAMAARPDRTDALAGYEGPSVVVVGDEDELSPVPTAQHMVEALKDSELVVVRGAGHMTSNESPEPVAAALGELLARAGRAAARV